MPRKYYYQEDGVIKGPVPGEVVSRLHHAKKLPENALIWRRGLKSWRPYRSVFDFRAVVSRFITLLTGVQDSGVEWKGFFSCVFERHTWADVKEVFCATTQPGGLPMDEVNISAPKPWLYSRVLLLGIILVILAFLSVTYVGSYMVLIVMPLAAVVSPLAVLTMAYELNTRRDLSTMAIVRALLGVFILTIPLAIFLNAHIGPAWKAGFTEEPTKLLTVLVLAGLMRIRMNRVLRAILLGCAVGFAFGFLETCQYLAGALQTGGLTGMAMNALGRGIVATPGHVIWTGITAGAFSLAQVQWERIHGRVPTGMFLWRNLLSGRFWRIAWIAVACHALHNSFPFVPDPVVYFVGCCVLWRLVRVGYVQMHYDRRACGADTQPRFSKETHLEPLLRALSLRFSGCMSRRCYWFLLLGIACGIAGLSCLLAFGGTQGAFSPFLTMELTALCIWTVPMLWSMMVRRLHDVGRSGWHSLYLFPFSMTLCSIPYLILGLPRGKPDSPYAEAQDTPLPHAPVDVPETDPVERLSYAKVPTGMMPCTSCCVPDGEENWMHCPTCGGTHCLPLIAQPQNLPVVHISLPWTSWKPSLTGRVARKTYWGMAFILTLITVSPLLIEYGVSGEIGSEESIKLAMLLGLLSYFVWGTGLTVRRLHDVGRSGLWAFFLVPGNFPLLFLPGIILGLVDSQPGTNQWGTNLKA